MNASDTPVPSPTPIAAPPRAITSRLAVASLILGILGFLIVPALAGLVCGVVAIVKINRSAGALKGMGLAVSGTVVSCLMLLMVPVVAVVLAILLPAFAKMKAMHQGGFIPQGEVMAMEGRGARMELNNVKQICLAMHLYAGDAKDTLPAAANWCDSLETYLGNNSRILLRPADHGQDPATFCSYGFNARLAGMPLNKIDSQTVLIFELQSGGRNITGGPELLRQPQGPGDQVVIGFVDGHVEARSAGADLDRLRWDP